MREAMAMGECALHEAIVPGNCSRCDRELKELLLYRKFILDSAKSVEEGSYSHTDLANEVIEMATLIRDVGWPMRDVPRHGDASEEP